MPRLRLVLGTVQLGMKYGVNNKNGQPSTQEAFAILDAAVAAGIDTFDTASVYGDAERVLGEWIEARAQNGKVRIITKIKAVSAVDVRTEICNSLGRLRMEHLDGCLLHVPQQLYQADMVAGLQEAKQEGLTAHIGVSVYEEKDALHAIEIGMDYIQVPYNVFDQRLDKTDFFERAREAGVMVFARSPFLQGLLLMDPDALPAPLARARPYLEKFIAIAQNAGLSQSEAALMFALEHGRADYVVFGTETVHQLQEIVAIARSSSSRAGEWMEEAKDAFADVPLDIIDPSVWNKKK